MRLRPGVAASEGVARAPELADEEADAEVTEVAPLRRRGGPRAPAALPWQLGSAELRTARRTAEHAENGIPAGVR
jgi:hypothetical protein